MLDDVTKGNLFASVYGLGADELEKRLREMLSVLHDATQSEKVQAHAVLMRVKELYPQSLEDSLRKLWGACVLLVGGSSEQLITHKDEFL